MTLTRRSRTIARPALRYHGGKYRIAPWILKHFPPHTHYVEVFGGGGSILLSKPPSVLDTYNDIDHAVVTFFRVLQDRPEELIRALELTPWAREELKLSRHPAGDEVETARRLFVGAWQGRGKATTQWSTGWRYQVTDGRHVRTYTDGIDTVEGLRQVAERLRRVQLDCDDWRAVLDRYDAAETLFYLDPPYPSESRSERWKDKAYRYEMSNDDHREMAARLKTLEGMALVSSYPSALYEKLFGDWTHVQRKTNTDSGYAVECLWISPSALGHLKQQALF